MNQRLVQMVSEEMVRAMRDHGPMTDDPVRALAILGEEVGEVCAAVLGLERIRRGHERLFGTDDQYGSLKANLRTQRGHAIRELAQVMAVAAMFIDRLEEAGSANTCGPSAVVV